MIELTDSEKNYLWSRLEYTKKKKATETKNDVYGFLNGERNEFTEYEFIKILNSLEFTFRKKLRGFDKSIKNDDFISLQGKLPEVWVGVAYSNIGVHSKKQSDESGGVKKFDDFIKDKKQS